MRKRQQLWNWCMHSYALSSIYYVPVRHFSQPIQMCTSVSYYYAPAAFERIGVATMNCISKSRATSGRILIKLWSWMFAIWKSRKLLHWRVDKLQQWQHARPPAAAPHNQPASHFLECLFATSSTPAHTHTHMRKNFSICQQLARHMYRDARVCMCVCTCVCSSYTRPQFPAIWMRTKWHCQAGS